MDIYFCYPVNQNIQPIALKTLFFGIKCYINQARNNIFTNPSVNVFIILLGTRLESRVYIGATEVEISYLEYERKVILRKLALKI